MTPRATHDRLAVRLAVERFRRMTASGFSLADRRAEIERLDPDVRRCVVNIVRREVAEEDSDAR